MRTTVARNPPRQRALAYPEAPPTILSHLRPAPGIRPGTAYLRECIAYRLDGDGSAQVPTAYPAVVYSTAFPLLACDAPPAAGAQPVRERHGALMEYCRGAESAENWATDLFPLQVSMQQPTAPFAPVAPLAFSEAASQLAAPLTAPPSAHHRPSRSWLRWTFACSTWTGTGATCW